MRALPGDNSPRFLCFASRGGRVIALCKHETRAEAEAWAERARAAFVRFADQVAILRACSISSIFGGKQLHWEVLAGWLRVSGRFAEVAPGAINTRFAELDEGSSRVP